MSCHWYSGNPAATSCASMGSYPSRHRSQSFRRSRWATTQSMPDATRYASTSISWRRVSAEGRAVRLAERGLVALVGLLEEPQLLHRQQHRLLVQDPDDDLLPEHRRERRQSEVDAPAAHLEADPAVLRDALLGDVHLAHDL